MDLVEADRLRGLEVPIWNNYSFLLDQVGSVQVRPRLNPDLFIITTLVVLLTVLTRAQRICNRLA